MNKRALVAAAAFVTVSGSWTVSTTSAAAQTPPTRGRTAPPPQKAPTPREVRLLSENDSLRRVIADLQAQLTARLSAESGTQAAAKSKALRDQIVVRLERLQSDKPSFVQARTKSDLTAEETRLKSLAREQEGQARSLVAELRAAGYTLADSADRLVQVAASSFVDYIGNDRLAWEWAATVGQINQEAETNRDKYYGEFIRALAALKALR